ncbi:Uncharacterised protein [Mycobacteroides abscessus subsp. abscessus]|nr:Uncharacterised protein [Mycobacteroides abscessus subsp. abscessus]
MSSADSRYPRGPRGSDSRCWTRSRPSRDASISCGNCTTATRCFRASSSASSWLTRGGSRGPAPLLLSYCASLWCTTA